MQRSRSPLGPRFLAVFTASSLSNLSDGILSIGIGLVVISMTTSPTLVGLATAAFTLPWLLLGIYSGVVIDSSDRRRVIIAATTLRIACLATGTLALAANFMTYPLLLVIIFIFGCCEVFADNAYTVILPSIVPTKRLPAANSRLLSAQQVTNNFLGAPLSGFLFAIGSAWAFGIPTALCLAALLVIVFGLRGTYRPAKAEQNAAKPSRARHEIKVGISYLFRHPIFRPLVLASAVQNMIYSGYFSVMILWIVGPNSRMKLAESHYGLLFTMLAIGSICGAMIVEKLLTRFHEIRILGAAWLTAAALLIVPLIAPNVFAVAAMLLFSGMGNTIGNTVSMTLRQRLIPDELLGRVFGASQTINLGLIPIGTIIAGLIAQYAGIPAWIITATVVAVAVVLAAMRAVPPSAIPPAEHDDASRAPEVASEHPETRRHHSQSDAVVDCADLPSVA